MSNLESLNRHVADIRVKTKWGLSLSGPLRFFRKFASGVGRVANLRRGCLPRLPQDRVRPWLVDHIFIGGDGSGPAHGSFDSSPLGRSTSGSGAASRT